MEVVGTARPWRRARKAVRNYRVGRQGGSQRCTILRLRVTENFYSVPYPPPPHLAVFTQTHTHTRSLLENPAAMKIL